jgi:hypothetical protein
MKFKVELLERSLHSPALHYSMEAMFELAQSVTLELMWSSITLLALELGSITSLSHSRLNTIISYPMERFMTSRLVATTQSLVT